MPSIFLRYSSWLVTGMTLVMSLIAAAMVTAISGTIMVEEDELLQFAVDSGELIIRRMMDIFQFSYICTLSGNRASLTVVLHLEPLPEVGTSDSPEQRDPSSTPVERTRSPQPHTILYPGYPFRLRCPFCPRRLEFLEYCHHSEHGFTILRRHPSDPEDSIVSRQEIHDHPFLFLRFVPGPRHTFPHPNPENPNRPRRFSHGNRPAPSPTTILVDEAIRTAIAQETPPPSSSSSQQSFTFFLPRNDKPINEIPQNPHPYQKDNFAFAKVMDPITTDLQELPADPLLEEGLPPHLVAEYRFAWFQDPLLEGTNKFHLPIETTNYSLRALVVK
jgi:hypothetical protein